MKISIAKSILLTPLNQIAKVSGSAKGSIPILGNILFDVNAEGLRLVGGSGDIFIQANIPFAQFETKSTGSITIPAKEFHDIVKKSGDTLEIETVKMTVKIKSGKFKFDIEGISAEMYPDLPEESGDSVSVLGEQLKTAITKTTFATADNASTPVLEGVKIIVSDGTITAIACDRHRLSKLQFGETGETEASAIVKGKSLEKLKDLLNDKEEVSMYFGENQFFVKMKHFSFFSRVLDGTYPDTSRLIPNSFKCSVTTSRTDLIDALDRSLIVSAKEKNNIANLNVSGEEIEISAKAQNSNVSESLDAEISGDGFKISCNAEYVIQALKTIEGEKVTIYTNGELNPFILKGATEKEIQLVLPYRTNG